MTQASQQRNDLAGPGIMLISAAVFAYFGFGISWLHHSVVTGEFLLFVALLVYTLKVTAIAFAAAAALTAFISRFGGNLLYATAGLLSAIMFVVISIMDWLDPQHTAISPTVLLLAFAAWNGYGSWLSLREILAQRRVGGPATPHEAANLR